MKDWVNRKLWRYLRTLLTCTSMSWEENSKQKRKQNYQRPTTVYLLHISILLISNSAKEKLFWYKLYYIIMLIYKYKC